MCQGSKSCCQPMWREQERPPLQCQLALAVLSEGKEDGQCARGLKSCQLAPTGQGGEGVA